MKIIDLLVKIANKEEVPNKIHIKKFQCDFIFNGYTYLSDEKEQQNIYWCLYSEALNYEVEIIEEDKKIKKIEKIVYNGWAFSENEWEKGKINSEIYEALKRKYKILKISDINHKQPTDEELNNNDIVYSREACYLHGEYRIYKCPEEVTFNELSLICDNGNLCFGSGGNKKFLTVFED